MLYKKKKNIVNGRNFAENIENNVFTYLFSNLYDMICDMLYDESNSRLDKSFYIKSVNKGSTCLCATSEHSGKFCFGRVFRLKMIDVLSSTNKYEIMWELNFINRKKSSYFMRNRKYDCELMY